MTREESHARLKKLVDDFFDGLEASEKPELSPAKECQASFQSREQYSWMSIDAREIFMFHAGVEATFDLLLNDPSQSCWLPPAVALFNRYRERLKR